MTLRHLTPLLVAATLFALVLPAVHAQSAAPVDHSAHHAPAAAAAAAAAAPAPAGSMADGEVRRIDKVAGKITLRHGEIKSLDMPPMTMVFQVAAPAMLDALKVGDKIRFKADQSGGTYRVTEIVPAP